MAREKASTVTMQLCSQSGQVSKNKWRQIPTGNVRSPLYARALTCYCDSGIWRKKLEKENSYVASYLEVQFAFPPQ